jgi:hypothetical protein
MPMINKEKPAARPNPYRGYLVDFLIAVLAGVLVLALNKISEI